MAKENVLTVSVSGETVNIMVFEIQRDENDKITKIIFCGGLESNLKNVIEDIKTQQFMYGMNIVACLIDTMACGIDVFRRLKLEKDFTIPIYETKRRIASVMINSKTCLKDFLETDFVEVKQGGLEKYDLIRTLNKFNQKSNGLIETIADKGLALDIAFMVNVILTYKEDMIKERRKIKIKDNLNEVIDIFIEELNELDKNDTFKLDNLLKMIDRINYVKGQV